MSPYAARVRVGPSCAGLGRAILGTGVCHVSRRRIAFTTSPTRYYVIAPPLIEGCGQVNGQPIDSNNEENCMARGAPATGDSMARLGQLSMLSITCYIHPSSSIYEYIVLY
ncbi:hypothetical protein M413DRAFT_449235, partial [Hebeloma cylindrosporum]